MESCSVHVLDAHGYVDATKEMRLDRQYMRVGRLQRGRVNWDRDRDRDTGLSGIVRDGCDVPGVPD